MNHQRAYGALLHLYPRRFRRAWETELRQAFNDQLVRPVRPTRHPAARAWLSTSRDLAISVPRQRMEQVMDRTSALWNRFAIARPLIVAVAIGAAAWERGQASGNARGASGSPSCNPAWWALASPPGLASNLVPSPA